MGTNIFSKKNRYRKSEEIYDDLIEKIISIGVLERVSSDMQALEGDSLEMQRELAEQKAEELGAVIYKHYLEDGLSASKVRIEKREKVQELMQDIRDGKVNYVIAYKRDRMFRNNIEHMQFLQFLADHDCDIYFSARGEMQVDLSAFKVAGASKMMESMLSMMAEMESAQTSARTSDTMISKAFKGERTGGRLPVGYKWEEDKIVPIEGATEVIEMVENLYLSGIGVKSIAKWLNGGKVKGLDTLDSPIPKPTIYAKSDEWNQRNIKTILFNPIYTGHNSFQSRKNPNIDRIVEVCEVVVPIRSIERQKQIFELQQKKVEEKKPPRAYNTPFILSGLIYCAECGDHLKTQTSQLKSGTRYSYYRCKHRYTDKAKMCKMSRIYRKEVLEKLVIEIAKEKLKELLDGDTYEIFRKKSNKDAEFVKSQIELVTTKIKQLNEDIKEYAALVVRLKNDELQKNVYLNLQKEALLEVATLNETHERLIEQLEKEKQEEYDYEKFLSIAKDFSKVIDSASIGVQKQILENLFSSIQVNDEGEIRLEFKFGSTKKQKTELLTENVVESSDKRNSNHFSMETLRKPDDWKIEEPSSIPSFISLETIRDWRGTKDINDMTPHKCIHIKALNEWTVSFNYFDVLKNMFEKIRISFYPFLCKLDKKFDIANVDLINEDELINYVPASNPRFLKSKKFHTYIEQTLDIKKAQRTRIIYGHLPPYEKIKSYLAKLSSNIDEFFDYIKEEYDDFIITDEFYKDIESTVNTKAIKTDYLFSDLIKCGKCRNKYTAKKEGKGVRYRCVKNHPARNVKCGSPSIKETTLIEQFKKDTGLQISREILLDKIDEIVILENGEPIIHYKKVPLHS